MPARIAGSRSSWPTSRTSVAVAWTSAGTSGDTSMAASPISLMSLTGGSATSDARSSSRSVTSPTASTDRLSLRLVNETRSANETPTSRDPGSTPSMRSVRPITSRRTTWRMCSRVGVSSSGPSDGISAWASPASRSPTSRSVSPAWRNCRTNVRRIASALCAADRPAMRASSSIRSSGSPVSSTCLTALKLSRSSSV